MQCLHLCHTRRVGVLCRLTGGPPIGLIVLEDPSLGLKEDVEGSETTKFNLFP